MNNNEINNNLNTASVNIKVGKLSFANFELNDVDVTAQAVVTDERVKVECDFAGKILMNLLAKFGDVLVDRINAETECTRSRKSMYEDEAATQKARAKMYDAEAEKYAAEAAKFKAETNQITKEVNNG